MSTGSGIDASTPEGLAALVRGTRLPEPAARRQIREAAGVTLREAAAACGVTPMALLHWERGTVRPRRENAVAYATLLTALRRATQ